MSKLLIILAIFLSGCSTVTEFMCKDILVTEEKIVIDSRYYEECQPLNTLGVNPTFSDVLLNTVENAEIYNICSSKQRDSILLLKRFTNR
jgi:hypothetical protein